MKNCPKLLPKSWLPLGVSLLKAVPDPPQLFCFKLLHQPFLFFDTYQFDMQGISYISKANNKVKRGQNNSNAKNHSPSIRLKGFESARILWRSSSSSPQFSSRSSMLWRPSQSSLMSSRSWGRQLLCESSNEEWKQHHWFVAKIWGCFNTMLTFTLSMTSLLLTVLCLDAPIEFWTASRRRLCKRQDHCYKVSLE